MVSSSSGSRALARSRRMPLAPIFVRPRCRATLGYTFQDQCHVCAGTPQGPTARANEGVVARICRAEPDAPRRNAARTGLPVPSTHHANRRSVHLPKICRTPTPRCRPNSAWVPETATGRTSLAADRNAVAVARAPLAPSRSPSHTLALVPLQWLPSRQPAARRRRMRSAGLQPSLALSRIAARLPQTQSAQAVLLCRT